MPNTGSIRAGRVFVELFADDSKLVRGLKAAQKKLAVFGKAVRSIGTKMAGLGAAVVVPLAGAAKAFADTGSRLWDMSQRTGASVEALSVLGFAAEQSGVDMESLEAGLRKMQRSIAEAASGSKNAQEALAQLGLTAKDLVGLAPERQFALIADRIDKIADPAMKAAAAMDIFGRGGAELLPMMEGGAAGLKNWADQARKLGLVISTQDAKAADALGDALGALLAALKRATFAIGAALAPTLQDLAERFTRGAVIVGRWLDQNRQIVVTVLQVAAAVMAVGAALTVLGYAISGMGAIFGALATVATTVGVVLKALVAVIGFMVTPLGLVITAVAALGAYLVYASGMGGKALSWLGEKFAILRSDAVSAYQGIADALAAGDIGLAAKILWLTLKMEWQRGVQWLQGLWLNFRTFFISTAYDAFYGAVAVCETVWHGLEVAWIETTAFLSKTWIAFTGLVSKAWNWCGTQLTKAWNKIKGLFDSGFDANTANVAADQAYQAGMQQIEQQTNQQYNQREQVRQQDREQSAALHNATMGQIGQESLDKERQLQNEYDQKMKDRQGELDQARQEWQQAIDEAAKKRTAKEAQDNAPDKLKGPDDLLAGIQGKLAGVGDLLAKNTIGVSGTFSAMEARGLGAGGVADRIANAAEQTAANTKKLLDEARNGGAQFD